jgi:hypothetical protein
MAIRMMTISRLKPTLPGHSVLRMKSRSLQHPDFPENDVALCGGG